MENARNQRQTRGTAIDTAYNTARNAADQSFQSTVDGARNSYTQQITSIGTAFQTAMTTASSDYDSALTAADTAYTAASTLALSTYQSAYTTLKGTYDAAVSAAETARDSQLSGVSTSFDLSVVNTDTAYQAALSQAQTAYQSALDVVLTGYHNSMDAALAAYNLAIGTANTNFDTALDTADTIHDTALTAAVTTYTNAINTANTQFDQQVAQLRNTFDTTVNTAESTYDDDMQAAADDYEQDLLDADDKYHQKVDPVQAALNQLVASIPGQLKQAAEDAAKDWVTAIVTAQTTGKSTLLQATGDHFLAVSDATNDFFLFANGAPFNSVEGALSQVYAEILTEANSARQDYFDTISQPLPNGSSMNAEDYFAAFQARDWQAIKTYLNRVGQKAISELDSTLKQAYESAYNSYHDERKSWSDAGADADYALSEKVASVRKAIDEAKESGEPKFLKTVTDKREQLVGQLKQQQASLEKAKAEGEAQRVKDEAKAEQKKVKEEARAGKAFVDAVAEARKTYVDDYATKWKALQTKYDDAEDNLSDAVEQADADWIDAVVQANTNWNSAVNTAATAYDTQASTAETTAAAGIEQAIQGYVTTVGAAWSASLNGHYSNSSEIGTVTSAWTAYAQSIVSAWGAADSASVTAANAYYTSMTTASNDQDDAMLTAFTTLADRSKSAMQTARDAGAAARRTFDDTYATAAVDRARAIAAAEEARDKDTQDANKQESDAEADAFKTVQDADATLYEQTKTAAIGEIESTAQAFITEAKGIIDSLMDASIAGAKAAAAATYQTAVGAAKDVENEVKGVAKDSTGKAKIATSETIANFQAMIKSALNTINQATSNPSSQFVGGDGNIPDFVEMALSLVHMDVDSTKMSLSSIVDQIPNIFTPPAVTDPDAPPPPYPGPGGASFAYLCYGYSGFAREPLYSQGNGTFIGMKVPLLGLVIRMVPNGTGGQVQATASLAAVQAQDQTAPAWIGTDWDFFFGGRINPGSNDPPATGNPIVDLITWAVPAENLAAPGGLASDVLITADLVTNITGLIDPTPISDSLQVGIQLSQGNNQAAAIAAAGILVPGALDKVARQAKHVPNSMITNGTEAIQNGLRRTGDDMARISQKTGAADEILATAKARPCNATVNCFVAGTPVVTSEGTSTLTARTAENGDEDSLALLEGIGALGLGIVLAKVKGKDRRKVRLRRKIRVAKSFRQRTPVEDTPTPEVPPIYIPTERITISLREEDTIVLPKPSSKPFRGQWWNRLTTAAMLVCFAVGSFWISQAAWRTGKTANASALAVSSSRITQNIKDIRLGQRVVGRNPLRGETQPASAIDPATWRAIRLTMDAHDIRYDLAFLRPMSWLTEQGGAVGGTIPLYMPEMGLDGPATVVAVEPCPSIERDDGTERPVVTGTMAHRATNVLDITLAGNDQSLGVTTTHPMWSADRQQFVVAGELQRGERLQQSDGTLVQITRITPRTGPPVTVYNLEIDGEHVFRVGEYGLLVHNSCPQDHHLVSRYDNLNRPIAADAIKQSREILANAGKNIDTKGISQNLRSVPGHIGKQHTVDYHKSVAKELSEAVDGLTPGTTAYTEAVEGALNSLYFQIRSGDLPLY